MSADWRETTWDDEINLEYGKALRNYKESNGTCRVYGSNGPVGWTEKPLAPGPGVILGRKGAYRGVEYSKDPFYVIDTAYYVKPKTEIDMRWLYYAIKYYKLGEIDDGSPIPSTTRAAVYVRGLRVPPPDVQREIAKILGVIDDKIELNRQMNATLEEMAQALFKRWFVDFEFPFDFAQGRPSSLGQPYKSSGGKMVDSELGQIPEGWEAGTLSSVADYCSGRISASDVTCDNYISTENMLPEKRGVVRASKLPTAKTLAAYHSGDVLISNIRPYFKKIWLADGIGGRSNDVLGFEPCAKNTNIYLMNLLYQDEFFDYMTRTAKGAKMPRGDKEAIMNWELCVPPVELREQFSDAVAHIYKLLPQNKNQTEILVEVRDTLLPKLLSGELDVSAISETEEMCNVRRTIRRS